MSKRITVPWYIVAWGVWALALVAYIGSVRAQSANSSSAIVVASIVAILAAVVTLVMWVGALVKLGLQRAWRWFVAVLVLHLVGLGIIGMIAYGVAGPADPPEPVVVRPRSAG